MGKESQKAIQGAVSHRKRRVVLRWDKRLLPKLSQIGECVEVAGHREKSRWSGFQMKKITLYPCALAQ